MSEARTLLKGDDQVIVLAGMIGAGKTRFTDFLAKELGSEPFFESVEDNRLLEKFYADPKRWSFALQIYFLNTRFRSIKKALQHKNNVLDRSIYEDALFTRINFEEGNMSDAEMDTYLDLLDNMMEELDWMPKKSPDLLIYLRGPLDVHLERIKNAAVAMSKSKIIQGCWSITQTSIAATTTGLANTIKVQPSSSRLVKWILIIPRIGRRSLIWFKQN